MGFKGLGGGPPTSLWGPTARAERKAPCSEIMKNLGTAMGEH